MHNWGQLPGKLAGWLAGLPKPVGLMVANDARVPPPHTDVPLN